MDPLTLLALAGAALGAFLILRPAPAQAAAPGVSVPTVAPVGPAATPPSVTEGVSATLGGQLQGGAALGGVALGVGLSFIQDWAAARDAAAAGAAGIKALFEKLTDMLGKGAYDAWFEQGNSVIQVAGKIDAEIGRFAYRVKTRSGTMEVNTVTEFFTTAATVPIPGYFSETGPSNRTLRAAFEARRSSVVAAAAARTT